MCAADVEKQVQLKAGNEDDDEDNDDDGYGSGEEGGQNRGGRGRGSKAGGGSLPGETFAIVWGRSLSITVNSLITVLEKVNSITKSLNFLYLRLCCTFLNAVYISCSLKSIYTALLRISISTLICVTNISFHVSDLLLICVYRV